MHSSHYISRSHNRGFLTFSVTRLICSLLISSVSAIAQIQAPQTGLPPNASVIPVPLGTVNTITGHVHLEIPIAHVPEHNDVITEKFVYEGGSCSWTPNGGTYLCTNWNPALGSDKTLNVVYDTITQSCPDPAYPVGNSYVNQNFRLEDIRGTTYTIGPGLYTQNIRCYDINGNRDPNQGWPASFTTTDLQGEGYTLQVTNYSTSSGVDAVLSNIEGDQTISGITNDRNGNYMGYIDSFGRNPFPIQNPYSSPIQVYGSDGSSLSYTLNYSNVSIIIPPNPAKTISILSSISLSNGTQYSFTYDTGTTGTHTGILTAVTLPTGGQVSFGGGATYPTSITYAGNTWNLAYNSVGSGQTFQAITTVTGPPRFDVATQSYLDDNTVYTSVVGGSPAVQEIKYYSGSSTLLKTIDVTYVQPPGGTDPYGGFISTVTTTMNTGQASKVQYFYDLPYKNYPSKIQEWDFGASAPTRTTTFSPQGPFPTNVSVYAGDGSGAAIAVTTYGYDEYSSGFCTVPGLSDAGSTPGHNSSFNTGYTNRHNITTISRWVSGSTWLATHKCYNTLGAVTQEADEAGNHTTYDYSDTDQWADSACIPAGTNTGGILKTITNALGLRIQKKYYTCTGLLQSSRNENDLVAGRLGRTYTYDDLGFNTSVTTALGGQTTHTPHYISVPFSIDTSRQIDSQNSISSTTLYDGYNRRSQTKVTSDPDGIDYTDVSYSLFGTTNCESTPYHSQSDSTYDNDCYNYDALGRVTKLTRTDGSTVTTSYGIAATSICGFTAFPRLVTDEAGNKAQNWNDAFGSLVEVDNQDSGGALSIATCYQYDAIGNLQKVTERGGTNSTNLWRTRNYAYDGISRMTSASNPESNTVTYRYDSDSNCTAQSAYPGELISETDGRGIRTCMQHDALHRLIGKTYSDNTPAVAYFYDQTSYNGITQILNGKGQRTGMSDGTGQTAWSYDADENVLTKRQTIAGVTNSISYVYNLDDSVQSITSPNGHTYSYSYNNAERQIKLADNGAGITYTQNAHYYAPGQLSSASHGLNSVITETDNFNSRQQPTLLSVTAPSETLLSLSYNWVLPGNVDIGSVYQIQNNRDATRSVQFDYDQLNRLTSAKTYNATTWGDAYVYDNWGNLLQKNVTQGTAETLQVTVDANNHINTSGMTYDGAGNLTWDTFNALKFDAENRVNPVTGYVYSYDGDDHRVEKNNSGSITYFWYDDNFNVIATTGALVRDYVLL